MTTDAVRRHSGEITVGARLDAIEADVRETRAGVGRIETHLELLRKSQSDTERRLTAVEVRLNDDERGLGPTRERTIRNEAQIGLINKALVGVAVFVLIAVGGAILGLVVGPRVALSAATGATAGTP